MGKRGTKPIHLDWEQIAKLMSYQCTQKEVADFYGVSVDTLEDDCLRSNGMKLADFWDQKKSFGRIKLRKIQFDIAERMGPGAAAMAIWLDKKIFPEENPERRPEDDIHRVIDVSVSTIGSGKKTFPEFCQTAGYPPPFSKQLSMREFAFEKENTRILLGARGYGKTDYVTILGTAYDIYIMGAEASNLIITKSKNRNTAIIEEIANALIKNGVELEKQNSTCINIKGRVGKEFSVEVLTIKSSFRGRHPRRILMDDPVTEEDTSEAMRVLVKKKYNEALKLTQNVCIIGQPAHFDDLYAELNGQVETLLVPHGQIPELDHDLEAMRLAGVDQSSIEMSYHLRVPEAGSSIFSNLKFLDTFPVGDSVAFLDPSEGRDYTALSIVRGHFDGVAAHGKAWKRAWYHCLDELVEVLVSKGVKRLCFETNKHGDQPIIQLRQLLAPHGIGVVGKYSDSNKHAVIQAAGSYAHQIHLSKDSDKVYSDQVKKYEYGAKFDDSPDSLARCLEWLGLIRGKK